MAENPTPNLDSAAERERKERREFLRRCGRFAIVTPPAIDHASDSFEYSSGGSRLHNRATQSRKERKVAAGQWLGALRKRLAQVDPAQESSGTGVPLWPCTRVAASTHAGQAWRVRVEDGEGVGGAAGASVRRYADRQGPLP